MAVPSEVPGGTNEFDVSRTAGSLQGTVPLDPGGKMAGWLDEKHWPRPQWPATPIIQLRYEDYAAHELRSRYLVLENDFRSIFGNYLSGNYSCSLIDEFIDVVVAERLFGLLQLLRELLNSENPDLLFAANALNLVERYMVWISPSYILDAAKPAIRLRVEELPRRAQELFLAKLDGLGAFQNRLLVPHRSVYDEVINACNLHMLQEQIGNRLQLRRMGALRNWGLVLISVFLSASPLVAPSTTSLANAWSYLPWLVAQPAWCIYVVVAAVAFLGALGGFLSGLLQVRNSRVSLAEYQDSMLKLQLRPLLGAIISVLLFVLVSWNVLPGVEFSSVGSYFLMAFLSGFSERYFLKLLKIEPNDTTAVHPETQAKKAE